MAENSQGSFFSSVSPQQMLAILTLVGSMAVMQFPPLQTRRNLEQVASASVPNDDHHFHASNIEDPLGALAAQTVVHPEKEEGFDPGKQVQACTHWGFYRDQLRRHVWPEGPPEVAGFAGLSGLPPPAEQRVSAEQPVQLIFAYLRSGQDAPSKEQRQRDRHAVVYALHNSGYVPESEGRELECLMFCKPTDKMLREGMSEAWSADYSPKSCINIPFEWFKPIPGKHADPEMVTAYKFVCVLWLDSEAFCKMHNDGQRPLDCLRSVVYNLVTGHPRPHKRAPLQLEQMPPLALQPLQLQPPVELRLPPLQPELPPQMQWLPQFRVLQLMPPKQPAVPRRMQELPEGSVEVSILGPPSSELLAKFIGEEHVRGLKKEEEKKQNKVPKEPPVMRWNGPIRMSSPYATASAQSLLRLAGVGEDNDPTNCRYWCERDAQDFMNQALAGESKVKEKEDPKKPQKSLFLSVPCSDDYVATALIHEMRVRGVEFDEKTGNPRVAAGGGIPRVRDTAKKEAGEKHAGVRDTAKKEAGEKHAGVRDTAKKEAGEKHASEGDAAKKEAGEERASEERASEERASEERASEGDIVLISEFDTGYGRALPLTLYTAARGEEMAQGLPQDEDKHWHWYNYTRGLDGRFAVGEGQETKKEGGGTYGTTKKAADEEPRGINATDSLRRLAKQLKGLHEERRRANKPGIMAVGVLGGDVYDQLLILRALRPSFPHALFFCNNLDAWMWNSEELRTTRNLVVTTPFGLYLKEKYQKGKPPFRNAYQTCVFAGTLALVSTDSYVAWPMLGTVRSEKPLPPQERVHHYEIGRNGPVDLDCENHETGGFWMPQPREDFLWFLLKALALSWLCWLIMSNYPHINLHLRARCLRWSAKRAGKRAGKQGDTRGVHSKKSRPASAQAEAVAKADKEAKADAELEAALESAKINDWAKESFGRLMSNPVWVLIIVVVTIIFVLKAWDYTARPVAGGAEVPDAAAHAGGAHDAAAHAGAAHDAAAEPVSEIEPLSFTSGVSAWPFISLNFGAALLAAHLMLKALILLWRGERHLKDTYFPRKEKAAGNQVVPPASRTGGKSSRRGLGRLWTLLQYLFRSLRNHLAGVLMSWNLPRIVRDSKLKSTPFHKTNKSLDPDLLWDDYRRSSRMSARLLRSAALAAVICWVAMEMKLVLPDESYAIRGLRTRELSFWIEHGGLAAFIWLGTLVFDTLWLNRIFIDWFGKGQSRWSDDIVLSFFAPSGPRTANGGGHHDARCDYIDLRLIEDWTREIGRITALPFCVLACLCLARLGWFDQTSYPWHVIAILVFIAALVILGALRVHNAAEILRTKALCSLDWKPTGVGDNKEAEAISGLIKGISGGAFMSFWRQPVMEAVYWLVSALSVTGLWQAISNFAP